MKYQKKNYYTPAAGVKSDLKRLMNKFLASATVRFEKFSEIWRSLNMSYLCAARNTDREAREFVEKVLFLAREYFFPPYQFQVRACGLYLLYAVYQIQPVYPKAKIRLTYQEWEDSLHLLQQATQQSHLDVVYVFNRLIQEGAFLFCHTAAEMDTSTYHGDMDDAEDDMAEDMKEEKSAINKLFSYESMEQLSYLQDQYQRMKVALSGPQASKPAKSLDVVKDELVEDIVQSIQTFKDNVARVSKKPVRHIKEPEEDKEQPDNVGSRRQALKKLAFSSTPSRRSGLRNSSVSSPEGPLEKHRGQREVSEADEEVVISPRKAAMRRGKKSVSESDGGTDEGNKKGNQKNDKEEHVFASYKGPTSRRGKKDVSQDDGSKKNVEEDAVLISPKKAASKLDAPGCSKAQIPSKSQKKHNTQGIDEDSDSDKGSDEDYVPPTNKKKVQAKSYQPMNSKVASRKKFSFKEAHKPFNFSDEKRKMVTERSSSTQVSPNAPEKSNKGSTASGFRLLWSPVIKDGLLNVDEETQAKVGGTKKRQSNVLTLPTVYREEPVCKNKKKNTVVASTDSYEFYMAPTSNNVCKDIGDNADQPFKPKKKKTRSSYKVVLAPAMSEPDRRYFNALKKNKIRKGDQDVSKNDEACQAGREPVSLLNVENSESPMNVENTKFTPCVSKAETHQMGLSNLQTQSPRKAKQNVASPSPSNNTAKQNIASASPSNNKAKHNVASPSPSSYEVVVAPTASAVNFSNLGDNADSAAPTIPFKTAKFSHTIKGRVVSVKNVDENSTFSTIKSFESPKRTRNNRPLSIRTKSMEVTDSESGSRHDIDSASSLRESLTEIKHSASMSSYDTSDDSTLKLSSDQPDRITLKENESNQSLDENFEAFDENFESINVNGRADADDDMDVESHGGMFGQDIFTGEGQSQRNQGKGKKRKSTSRYHTGPLPRMNVIEELTNPPKNVVMKQVELDEMYKRPRKETTTEKPRRMNAGLESLYKLREKLVKQKVLDPEQFSLSSRVPPVKVEKKKKTTSDQNAEVVMNFKFI